MDICVIGLYVHNFLVLCFHKLLLLSDNGYLCHSLLCAQIKLYSVCIVYLIFLEFCYSVTHLDQCLRTSCFIRYSYCRNWGHVLCNICLVVIHFISFTLHCTYIKQLCSFHTLLVHAFLVLYNVDRIGCHGPTGRQRIQRSSVRSTASKLTWVTAKMGTW
jgi:hypothetical protein